MSSKAEKTLNHSHQQSRLNIFFRSPLLLKIVAWLGSLSFLGSTGMALAEMQPPSTARAEAQELIQASASPLPSSGAGTVKVEDQETYGPSLPIAQTPSPIQINLAQLLGREVPVAVAPADAVILPTGTIVRPQHADILTARNYTIGVNNSASAPTDNQRVASISAPVTQPSSTPGRSRGLINTSDSPVQPQSVISKSTPKTSIQPKSSAAQSVDGYRSVPTVASIPTLNSKLQHPDRISGSIPTARTTNPQPRFFPQVVPLAGLRSTAVKPMKPSATVAVTSTPVAPVTAPATVASSPFQSEQVVEIVVPAPKTGRIEVQSVAHLPLLSEIRTVPTVPSIPSVRPAAVAASQSQSTAFVNLGANESAAELGYPLSRPAPTTSRFGWRTHPITGSRRFHSGMDIGAPMGAPVVAAATGIIVSSGWLGGYGKAIVIQHNGVQQTLYGHLSEVFVQPGQRIEQGTVIGRVGSTGNSTGPHLHFEARAATSDGWVAVDPGEQIEYALENLRRAAPFAQRDLPPGYN
jgi:murein DD-endopeptidase MepM/ murein hydrolase activator NlpD